MIQYNISAGYNHANYYVKEEGINSFCNLKLFIQIPQIIRVVLDGNTQIFVPYHLYKTAKSSRFYVL